LERGHGRVVRREPLLHGYGREGEGDDATVGAASCEDVADERQLAEQWGLVA